MPRLVLINGAPGSGKSTLAHRVAQHAPLTLALDVDTLKHSFGAWDTDPVAAGLLARRLALAVAREHLRSGHDVIVPQYLARTEFIEQLSETAASESAEFIEIMLVLDPDTLAQRLAARAECPDRPGHQVNNLLVGPEDAARLVSSIDELLTQRPQARLVDSSADMACTVHRVSDAIMFRSSPLRAMTAADVPTVLDLQEPSAVLGLSDVFPQDAYPFPRDAVAQRWLEEIATPGIDSYVVLLNDTIVGFAAIRGNELLHFGIAAEYWGTGIAKTAHDGVLDRMRGRGVQRAWLRVFTKNGRGRRFYEKCGWRATGARTQSSFPPYPELLVYERTLDGCPSPGA